MRFLCLKCEAYLTFRKVEQPHQGSLGVFFACERCGAGFCMVTNPGETQLVSSLGVQLGGREAEPVPLELTRSMLAPSGPAQGAGEARGAAQASEAGAAGPTGRCPFASVVAKMEAPAGPPLAWATEAEQRLNNIPELVRPFARLQIEKMARERGLSSVTAEVLDQARDVFMRMV